MTKATFSRWSVAVCLLCLGLVAWAFYNEYVLGMIPCLLCTIQRLILIMIIAIQVIDWFWKKTWLDGFQCMVCVLGVLAASRQWWLQLHPSSSAVCLPSFHTLLKTMPWHQAVWLSFQGSPSCAEVSWRILGVSSAAWMTVVFVLLFGYFSTRLVCRYRFSQLSR